MTSIEQHSLVSELCAHEMRMTAREREEFSMFRKRDKDDEDLDALSRKRLVELHEKYAVRPVEARNPLDALFRKMPEDGS